ncbi:MAG: hypothetical protein CL940_03300, partial [Deltaproteobacteria bacterium]|nr:hypothetical protein [Deltaproteobacteria bacterium]
MREGATPGEQEVADLAQIGRFVSALLARFTQGVSLPAPPSIGLRAPLSGQGDFEQRSPILSAATADRWMHSMGVGAAMLEPRLSRPPALEVDPFAWSSLAGEAIEELPIVELIETEITAAAARTSAPRRAAPRSLFGPGTAREALTFAPSASGRGDDSTSVAAGAGSEPGRITTVTLTDGSVMSLETVSALVSAGLSLGTQPREATDALRLDGLQVDHRTPALASALRHVAGYPTPSSATSPQRVRRHAVGSPERMGARVTAALEPHDASLASPVQLSGAYDSVAGDFLHVVPAPAPQATDAPPERAPTVSRQSSAPDHRASLSLSSLVQAPPGVLLPMTQGVFPSPDPGSRAVVGAQHAPSGRAIPALERGPMGPPLIRAQPVPAGPAAAPAQLGSAVTPPETMGRLAPLSSAPSLAAPTRSESMAAEVAAGRDGGRALGERFSPVVSGATGSRGDGGLDEVAWVSLSGPRPVSRDALESLPVGRALPLRPVETWRPEAAAPAALTTPSLETSEPVVQRGTQETGSLERLAASARNALHRPGLTAREIQEVAPLLAALVAEPVSGEHPEVWPSLVNRLEQRSTAPMGLAPERALDSGLGEALLSRAASPGAAISPEVRQAMALAGWN